MRGWLSAGVSALLAGCATESPHLEGPMPVRSQHPAQLTVQRLTPKDTVTGGAGHVDARWTNAYSSLFLGGSDGMGQSFFMDGEYWRTAVGARVGLGGGFEFDVELPFAHTTGGFLDSFIIGWHDAFGLEQSGRDLAPRNQYRIDADVGGNQAWQVDRSDFELLDVPLELSWSFAEAREPGTFGGTLRAGIEVPVGNDERGFGSGDFDYSVGAIGEYRGGRFGLTAHAEYTFAGQPEPARSNGLPFRDVTSAGLGAEFALSDRWAGVVQLIWETQTLRSLGFSQAADNQLNLWTGMRVLVGSSTRLEFTIGEDLAEFTAADVTFWLSVYHGFGG